MILKRERPIVFVVVVVVVVALGIFCWKTPLKGSQPGRFLVTYTCRPA